METPVQTVSRLLKALEELTAVEHHLLNTGALHEAHLVQEREIPLVSKISELMAQDNLLAQLGADTIARAHRIMQAQSHQLEQLAKNIEHTRSRLADISLAENRVQILAPVYRHSPYDSAPPIHGLAAQA